MNYTFESNLLPGVTFELLRLGEFRVHYQGTLIGECFNHGHRSWPVYTGFAETDGHYFKGRTKDDVAEQILAHEREHGVLAGGAE